MTREEFYAAMVALEAGTGKSLKESQVDIWFDCLSDLTAEQLHSAVVRYLREGDDWPSISNILKLAGSAMHGDCLSFCDSFDAMLRAVRQQGIYD